MRLNFDKLLEGSKTRIVDLMYNVEPNHELLMMSMSMSMSMLDMGPLWGEGSKRVRSHEASSTWGIAAR